MIRPYPRSSSLRRVLRLLRRPDRHESTQSKLSCRRRGSYRSRCPSRHRLRLPPRRRHLLGRRRHRRRRRHPARCPCACRSGCSRSCPGTCALSETSMRERHNGSSTDSSHPAADGQASDLRNCHPIRSSTDRPDPDLSAGLPSLNLSDPQVHARTLLECQHLVETQQAHFSTCPKWLLRVELRLCFLLLHFGSNQMTAFEWVRIHSRSKHLQTLLSEHPFPG